MEIILANPRGFCARVERALGIVERVLQRFGAGAGAARVGQQDFLVAHGADLCLVL